MGWSWVRTALDWFSGSSIIQYHYSKGLQSRGVAKRELQFSTNCSRLKDSTQRVVNRERKNQLSGAFPTGSPVRSVSLRRGGCHHTHE